MSSPVTFPVAERKGTETLQLVVDAISRASGVKILLLTVPFWQSDMVTFGAAGESAGDVIESIGKVIKRPISYQCLYDAQSKTYYLNVTIVAPEPVPGTTVLRGPRIKPGANTIGPPDSPWFVKKP